MDKGEWVFYSKHNCDRMSATEEKNKQTRLDKKKAKINKMLDKDYLLKQEIKKDFEYEEQREKEDFECR